MIEQNKIYIHQGEKKIKVGWEKGGFEGFLEKSYFYQKW